MVEQSLEGERLSLRAQDGQEIAARFHEADAPVAALLVNGAMAVPQRFYRRFGAFMADHGVQTLTYDYRGIGESRVGSLRNAAHSIDQWVAYDFATATNALFERSEGLPVCALGHSFGGQAFGLSATAERFSALMFVAAQSGYVGHWSGLSGLRMQLSWRTVVPSCVALLGYVPGWMGLGEDLPGPVASEWASWCLTPGYVTGKRPGAKGGFARLDMPRKVYSFAGDPYAPRSSVDELCSWLPEGYEREHVESGHVGHFGFFRQPGAAHWPSLIEWLRHAADRDMWQEKTGPAFMPPVDVPPFT